MPESNTTPSQVATCEDFDSDASEIIPGTRKQANVAAKRTSHPSDLGKDRKEERDSGKDKDKSAEAAGPDAASDSGYSSHTAATMSSADSAQSKAGGVSTKVADAPSTGTASPRKRPTATVVVAKSQKPAEEAPRSPQKAPARTKSVSKRSRSDNKLPCDCKDCRAKLAEAEKRRAVRKAAQPPVVDTTVALRKPQITQGQRSPQRPPPSPHAQRYPAGYSHPGSVIEPAQSRRRASTSVARSRPASYHAGSQVDGYNWGAQHPYGPSANQHGPPPARSAYTNPLPTPQQYAAPPYFTPTGQMTPGGMATAQRPPMARGSTDMYSARGGSSARYGPPLVHQPQYNPTTTTSSRPSARFPDKPQSVLKRQDEVAYFSGEEEESSEEEGETESESETGSESEDEQEVAKQQHRELREAAKRALMPPPKIHPARRPSVTQQKYPSSSRVKQSEESSTRMTSRPTTDSSSRNSSVRRPSLSSGRTTSTPYTNSSGSRMIVEPSMPSRRPTSYMGHDNRRDIEARHREQLEAQRSAEIQAHRRLIAEEQQHRAKVEARRLEVEVKRQEADLLARKKELAIRSRSGTQSGPRDSRPSLSDDELDEEDDLHTPMEPMTTLVRTGRLRGSTDLDTRRRERELEIQQERRREEEVAQRRLKAEAEKRRELRAQMQRRREIEEEERELERERKFEERERKLEELERKRRGEPPAGGVGISYDAKKQGAEEYMRSMRGDVPYAPMPPITPATGLPPHQQQVYYSYAPSVVSPMPALPAPQQQIPPQMAPQIHQQIPQHMQMQMPQQYIQLHQQPQYPPPQALPAPPHMIQHPAPPPSTIPGAFPTAPEPPPAAPAPPPAIPPPPPAPAPPQQSLTGKALHTIQNMIARPSMRAPLNPPPTPPSEDEDEDEESESDSEESVATSSRLSRAGTTTEGGFKMRIDTSHGMNIEFDGNMEGRVVGFRPTGDGQMELVVGERDGRERRYIEDGRAQSQVGSRVGERNSDPGRSRRGSRLGQRDVGREIMERREMNREERRRRRATRDDETIWGA